MADKKEPLEPLQLPPTEGQIKKDFMSDFERVLGVDDETLKQKQQQKQPLPQQPPSNEDDRTSAETTDGGPGAGRAQTAEAKGCRRYLAPSIVILIVAIAFGAYLVTGQSGTPRVFDELLGGGGSVSRQPVPPVGSTTKPAAKDETKTKRWLIIRGDNSRPQFTIELQGEGPTGRAVWLEPPPGIGTYEWSGDQLQVKLVLKQTAAPGLTFDQHFEIDMTRGEDDELTGTMSAENWRYSSDTGLELLGMDPYEATGQPK